MSETFEAIAESLIGHIRHENHAKIDLILQSVQDVQMWNQVLRHQLDLRQLMRGILDCDILVPRLSVFDIGTMSPFHYAALRGADGIVKRFVRAGRVGVDEVLESGTTALQLACFAGLVDTAAALVDRYHAAIDKKDKYGWTALHYATLGRQRDVIKMLVGRGADVTSRDKDGTTAAFRAHALGRNDLVELFVTSSSSKDELLLVDDSCNSDVPIYAKIDKTKSARGREESDYEIGIIPPEDELQVHTEVCKVNKANLEADEIIQPMNKKSPEVLNRTSRTDVSETEINRIGRNSSVGQKHRERESEYIGANTVTHMLRNEFLKFSNQKSQCQTGRPRKTILTDQSPVFVTTKTSNSGYEEIASYTRLPEVPEACRITDQSTETQSNGSRASVDSIGSIASSPAESIPSLPPRNRCKAGSNSERSSLCKTPSASFDIEQSEMFLILSQIEHDSFVMEASFQALAAKLDSADDWKKLAYSLPLRTDPAMVEEKIGEIEARFPGEVRRQTVELLRQWRAHRGDGASLPSLVLAMKNCGLVQLVRVVEKASKQCKA